MRNLSLALFVAAMLLLSVGCATTRVNFEGPPGTVLTVDNKPYHLPAQIELSRPSGTGGFTRHDVSLVTTVDLQELRAKGHIDALGYNESDVDKLAVQTLRFDDSHLQTLQSGTVVIFKGESASRQPIYELTLARQ
jgi:hypothetical protein